MYLYLYNTALCCFCKACQICNVWYRQVSPIVHSNWPVRIVSRNNTVTPYRCLVMASQLGFTISFLVFSLFKHSCIPSLICDLNISLAVAMETAPLTLVGSFPLDDLRYTWLDLTILGPYPCAQCSPRDSQSKSRSSERGARPRRWRVFDCR